MYIQWIQSVCKRSLSVGYILFDWNILGNFFCCCCCLFGGENGLLEESSLFFLGTTSILIIEHVIKHIKNYFPVPETHLTLQLSKLLILISITGPVSSFARFQNILLQIYLVSHRVTEKKIYSNLTNVLVKFCLLYLSRARLFYMKIYSRLNRQNREFKVHFYLSLSS